MDSNQKIKSEPKDDTSNKSFNIVLKYDKCNYNIEDFIRPYQIYFEPHHPSIPENSNSPLAITGLAFFRELLESTFHSIELKIKQKISENSVSNNPKRIPDKYILDLEITEGQVVNNNKNVSVSIRIATETFK